MRYNAPLTPCTTVRVGYSDGKLYANVAFAFAGYIVATRIETEISGFAFAKGQVRKKVQRERDRAHETCCRMMSLENSLAVDGTKISAYISKRHDSGSNE
jgi:hypothetical protein